MAAFSFSRRTMTLFAALGTLSFCETPTGICLRWWATTAFRIEAVQGREMLISRDGSAVVGLHAEGPVRSASLFGPRDLNGDAPARKASVPLPSQVLSVQDFLKEIDRNLVAVGRSSLRGEFYNEPRVRLGFLEQFGTHSGSELPQKADVPDNTQPTHDARPVWENAK